MVLQLDTFFYVTFVNVVRLFQCGQPFQWKSPNVSAEFEYHVIAELLELFFSSMFGLSSSISWIKLFSSLSLISVYLSVTSNSCLFGRNISTDTHKIQLFSSMWILNLWDPLVPPCAFHTLVFPACTCLSYQGDVQVHLSCY